MDTTTTSPYAYEVRINERERKLLDAMADALRMKPTIIVRRLMYYALEGKVSYDALKSLERELERDEQKRGFTRTRGTIKPDADDPSLYFLRIAVDEATEAELRAFAKSWDSTPGTLMTRLVRLYVFGYIKNSAIWEIGSVAVS
jgi:hypothetical protein